MKRSKGKMKEKYRVPADNGHGPMARHGGMSMIPIRKIDMILGKPDRNGKRHRIPRKLVTIPIKMQADFTP